MGKKWEDKEGARRPQRYEKNQREMEGGFARREDAGAFKALFLCPFSVRNMRQRRREDRREDNTSECFSATVSSE